MTSPISQYRSIEPFGQVDPVEGLRASYRQLYLEIRVICFLKDCLFEPQDSKLESCIEKYKEYQPLLSCKNAPDHIRKIDRELRSLLTELGVKKEVLIHQIRELTRGKSRGMQESWRAILEQYAFIQSVHLTHDVEEGVLSSWERALDQFQRELNRSSFPLLHFYESWENILQKRIDRLSQVSLLSLGNRVRFMVQTRKLIYREKEDHLRRVLQGCGEANSFDEVTKMRIAQLRKKVSSDEKKLLSSMGRVPAFLSLFAEAVLNSWYFQRAEFLIESQEKISVSRQWGDPIGLSKPLSRGFLNLSKGVTVCGLVTQDVIEWRLVGLTQQIPHVIAHQLQPTFNATNRFCIRYGGDEKITLRILSIFKRCVGAAIFVGVNSYFTSRTVTEIGLSHCVFHLVAIIAGKCVQGGYRAVFGDPEKCSTYELTKGVVEWVSFPLAAQYLMPYVWRQLDRLFMHPIDMMTDEAACLAYPLLCKRQACHLLGLSEEASLKEVRSAYRQLAKVFHPDHGGRATSFHLLSLAKELCSG